jgi:hypothetical protein
LWEWYPFVFADEAKPRELPLHRGRVIVSQIFGLTSRSGSKIEWLSILCLRWVNGLTAAFSGYTAQIIWMMGLQFLHGRVLDE